MLLRSLNAMQCTSTAVKGILELLLSDEQPVLSSRTRSMVLLFYKQIIFEYLLDCLIHKLTKLKGNILFFLSGGGWGWGWEPESKGGGKSKGGGRREGGKQNSQVDGTRRKRKYLLLYCVILCNKK